MANIIVHLTFSGLVALQPVSDPSIPYKWRITVPDFSTHAGAEHEAFLAYKDGADAVQVVTLNEMTAHIDEGTATTIGTGQQEILTFREACDTTTATDCSKVKEWAAFDDVPALHLWVADAELSATAVDSTVPWFLDRGTGSPKQKSGTHGHIAEEVCLTFETTAKTLKLMLDDGSKPVRGIEIPAKNDIIEVAVRNVGKDQDDSHKPKDPHFHMYYDILKGKPAKKADLINKQATGGTLSNPHKHQLQYVRSDGSHAMPAKAANGKLGVGLTGANCPPGTGDPYP
jgi:hypothetical protein